MISQGMVNVKRKGGREVVGCNFKGLTNHASCIMWEINDFHVVDIEDRLTATSMNRNGATGWLKRTKV
jgi:hypothetical protein